MVEAHEHEGLVSQDQCRGYQGECSKGIYMALEDLRKELDAKMTVLAAAGVDAASKLAEVAADVKVIKAHLGLNGQPGSPHPHKRDSEPAEHEHARSDDESVRLPRWLVALVIVLALLAGGGGAAQLVPALLKVVAP